MSVIDTPDYQRGVANAQILLAAEPSTSTFVVVGIPPNAETLVVVMPTGPSTVAVGVRGVTSGIFYPGYPTTGGYLVGASGTTWFFDVSNVIDEQVNVGLFGSPGSAWYVYADTGAHMAVDAANLRNKLGQQYVIPSAPGIDTQDHPPNELQATSGQWNANTVVLGAPGAGQRYRIFGAHLGSETAGGVGVFGSSSGQWGFWAIGVAMCATQFLPSGVPLPANTSVTFSLLAGTGFFHGGLTYTTETV